MSKYSDFVQSLDPRTDDERREDEITELIERKMRQRQMDMWIYNIFKHPIESVFKFLFIGIPTGIVVALGIWFAYKVTLAIWS